MQEKKGIEDIVYQILTNVSIDERTGCWLWKHSEDKYNMKELRKLSYCTHFAPLKKNLCVGNICNNSICVNPSHLYERQEPKEEIAGLIDLS